MLFYLKENNDIHFIKEELKENESIKNIYQIRHKDGISNTRICKRRNNTFFLLNGDKTFELKNLKINEMKVFDKKEKQVIGVVNEKWFIQKKNKKDLSEIINKYRNL